MRRTAHPMWRWALLALLIQSPACLKQHGDAEEADEEKSFIVGRWAFRRLEAAEAAVAEKKYDVAKEKLAEMQANEDLNAHEKALMWQLLGNIYADEKNYPEAVKALAACLALDALPDTSQATVQYNLGQLYAITGDYAHAIEQLEAWLAKETREPSRDIQLMLANAHVQLGQFDKALGYAEAVAKATETPDENLLLLQLAIHFELKHQERIVELLTELIERFPKKNYWLQLSAAHAQLGDDRRALAVLELAHRQGLLTEPPELLSLAQHYLHMNLPFQAAEHLEREMAAGRVPKTADNLELLANSWMAAREPKKAVDVLAQAAKESKEGELYLRLGQLLMQQERWGEAQSALQKAISLGGLRDPGNTHLLLGNSHYELGQRGAARQAFGHAAESDKSRPAAERWLMVMQKEDESCPTGREAACKLIPGHH